MPWRHDCRGHVEALAVCVEERKCCSPAAHLEPQRRRIMAMEEQ